MIPMFAVDHSIKICTYIVYYRIRKEVHQAAVCVQIVLVIQRAFAVKPLMCTDKFEKP